MMFRALVTIGLLQLMTMVLQLVRAKSLALLLGPELIGPMGVIDKLLAVIVQTVSLSLPFAAVRFLPERWAEGPAEYRALFERMRNVLLLLTGVSAAGALAVTLVSPAVWGAQLVSFRTAIAAAALTVPVVGLMPFLQNAMAGRLEQSRAMMAGLLYAAVMMLAVAGVWWGGLTGYYLLYGILGLILLGVVTRWVLRDNAGTPLPRLPRTSSRVLLSLPRPIWRFSAAFLIIAFFSPYAALFVHYDLLRRHGVEAAGWMQAAFGIAIAVRTVLGSAHSVFLTPNVNQSRDIHAQMTWTNRFLGTFCVLAGLTVPVLLLFPDLAVRLLYSSAFLPAATVLAVFVTVEVANLVAGTYQVLLVAQDRIGAQVLVTFGAQLLVLAAASQLIAPLGLLGAGLAGVAAPLFAFTTTMGYLDRTYRVRMPGSLALRSMWLLMALAGAGAAGVLVAPMGFWSGLAVRALVYTVIVVGFALLLSGPERQRVRHAVGMWRTRLFPVAF